jgi:hypothetical protein
VSGISDNARVKVLLADFANQDAVGKVNLIGANWSITGIQPPGMTPPQTLVVLVDVPSRFHGEDFALSMTLFDDAGDPVDVPGPTGEMQPLRVQQLVRAERPVIPGANVPPDAPGSVQVILNFGGGIPLSSGRTYYWRVEIDTNTNPQWETSFYVVGPPPAPVVG